MTRFIDRIRGWSWRKKIAVSIGVLTLVDLAACYVLTAFGAPGNCPFVTPHIIQLFTILVGLG